MDSKESKTSELTLYSSHSTVYCAGSRCDQRLLVSNDKVGVCAPGEVMPERLLLNQKRSNCSAIYYECLTDEATNLPYWKTKNCSKGQVFNRYSNQCNHTCKKLNNLWIYYSRSIMYLFLVKQKAN